MEISKFWMTVDNPYYETMADLRLPDGTMPALQIAPLDPQKILTLIIFHSIRKITIIPAHFFLLKQERLYQRMML
jgi:hypothetical protein